MEFLTFLEVLSLILTVIALHLLGKPSRKTFPIFIVSVSAQAYIFLIGQNWFLLGQMGVLLGYNIRNWICWKKEGIG